MSTRIHSAAVFHVGDVIRKKRLALRWNLDKLAAEAHVDKNTLSRIERGTSKGRRPTISKIAVALGTTSSELDASTVANAPIVRADVTEVDSEERELIEDWFQCGPVGRAAIVAYARGTRDAELRAAAAAKKSPAVAQRISRRRARLA